jgi:hypothetical protein
MGKAHYSLILPAPNRQAYCHRQQLSNGETLATTISIAVQRCQPGETLRPTNLPGTDESTIIAADKARGQCMCFNTAATSKQQWQPQSANMLPNRLGTEESTILR